MVVRTNFRTYVETHFFTWSKVFPFFTLSKGILHVKLIICVKGQNILSFLKGKTITFSFRILHLILPLGISIRCFNDLTKIWNLKFEHLTPSQIFRVFFVNRWRNTDSKLLRCRRHGTKYLETIYQNLITFFCCWIPDQH